MWIEHIHHPAQTTKKDFEMYSSQSDLLHWHPSMNSTTISKTYSSCVRSGNVQCIAFHFFIARVSALEFVTNCISTDATEHNSMSQQSWCSQQTVQNKSVSSRLSSIVTDGTADHTSKTLKLSDGCSKGHLVLLGESSKHSYAEIWLQDLQKFFAFSALHLCSLI